MPHNPHNAPGRGHGSSGAPARLRARGAAPTAIEVVCAPEPLPPAFTASVFLAGAPGPWRRETVALLAQAGFDGVVLIPELRGSYEKGTSEPPLPPGRLGPWQEEALRHTDALLLWLGDGGAADPQVAELWGRWQTSARISVGSPPGPGAGDGTALLQAAHRLRIPIHATLAETVQHCLSMLDQGALRRGGERAVPLLLWRSPSFQSWYRALRGAGHRLDDAQLEWTYRVRPAGRPPLLWAMRPRVFLPSERRHKSGEVVIGRSDISATVLYRRQGQAQREDTLVALVREFRSAVRNQKGYGIMLPGGSTAQAIERDQDARVTAMKEVAEETGLRLLPEQIQAVPAGDRQLAASLSCHHAHLFRAELTEEQVQQLRATAAAGRPLGINPNERCFVTLRTLRELQQDQDLDWSQLGMLLYALRDLP
jgi:8-oxo-dGTP pyrophosphatase MutT (NUDIX family)